MTDNSSQPQGAEVIIKEVGKIHLVLEGYRLKDRVVELMHTHTEDWLKYFAEKIVQNEFSNGRSANLDSLLSEVVAKMKEGK